MDSHANVQMITHGGMRIAIIHSNRTRKWHRRYFRLTRSPSSKILATLSWYREETDSAPQGAVAIDSKSSVRDDEKTIRQGFSLVCDHQLLSFKTETEAEKQRWMDVFTATIAGQEISQLQAISSHANVEAQLEAEKKDHIRTKMVLDNTIASHDTEIQSLKDNHSGDMKKLGEIHANTVKSMREKHVRFHHEF